MNFSVLASLYAKERPEYLRAALASLEASKAGLGEVVMVLDGPIGGDLARVLESFRGRLPLKLVPLPKNVGLGLALNAGLAACSHEWVARFDTDDLIYSDRFVKQVAFIQSHADVDIVGGAISEFDVDHMQSTAIRAVPEHHEEILKFARKRNPFNHMTVMYKRSVVQACGGYQGEFLYEDYALWVRMLQAGARAANLPDCLVRARAGNAMLARRGGLKYALSEVASQKSFLSQGFITRGRFLLNVAVRLPIRLCPSWMRSVVYRIVLRNRRFQSMGSGTIE